MNQPMRPNSAFSLVELSIVLVILGLLVGGVLTGKSLIRASELRAIPNELQRYTAATKSFQDKYFALPGDMTNASLFWGVAGGDGSGNDLPCAQTPSSDKKTCNGNGDGIINNVNLAVADNNEVTIYLTSEEPLRYWQHLANAGVIEGAYTGVYVTSPADIYPKSKFESAYWYATGNYSAFEITNTNFAVAQVGHYFRLTGSNSLMLTPTDAWNVDTKIDDGRPNAGKVIGFKGYAAKPCTTSFGSQDHDDTAEYNTSFGNSACSLTFIRVF